MTTPKLTHAQARTIIEAALAKARETNSLPLAVVVLDDDGEILAKKRENNTGLLRADIAFAKAYGALGMSLGSRQLAVRAAANPNFYNSLYAISQGRLATTPGGVLVRDTQSNEIIGAVGISGDVSNRDEECAIAGIEAVALTPDPGAAT